MSTSTANARSPAGGRPWLAMAALLTGNFVTILDLFIVNVALETIQRDLHTTLAEIQLVIVGYSAAYGVLLMNGARLGDLYGRRRMFLCGMAVFTAASLVCGIANTPQLLIAARVGQGAGAAILMPQVLSSLRILFDGDDRRRAFGIMGAVQGVAATISQLAGGFLIEHGVGSAGWRLIFLINVPIGIVAIIAGRLFIIETRADVPAKLDIIGAITLAASLVLLLVPFMEGREYGWPWWSVAGPLAAIPALWAFVRFESRLSARGGVPIIEMSLFANRSFVVGVAAIFLFYSAISSFFFSLTMLLQVGIGLSPFIAGAVFTPSAVGFFAGALASPRLFSAFGRRVLLFGVLTFAAGLALSAVTAATAPTNMPLLIVSLILNGVGQGIVIPLAFNFILSGVREQQIGQGSGTLTTMQTIGTSVGVAIVGVLLFSLAETHQASSANAQLLGYAHGFAVATLYNVAAAVGSLALFWAAWRRAAHEHEPVIKSR